MSLHINWSAESISGSRKKINDDSWAIFSVNNTGHESLPPEGNHSLTKKDLILAVSDGMGGAKAGYYASKSILEEMAKIVPVEFKLAAQGFNPDCAELLEEAIHKTHEKINDEALKNCDYRGMAATLTIAWFTLDDMHIGHVGDSRLYLLREGEMTQITSDHTNSWKKFNTGKVSETQYRMDNKRNILYEVIGAGHNNLNPDIYTIPYEENDRFMLCSDGIIDGLNQKKIKQHLSAFPNSTSESLQALIKNAIENSGQDDTTCIVFDVVK